MSAPRAGRLVLVLAGLAVFAPLARADRLADMPDFSQRDPRLPSRGDQYCAPVALANGLMWLSNNGFPELVPFAGADLERQYRLVLELGSPAFLDTSVDRGTAPTDVLRGATKYVTARGLAVAELWYWGWRPRPRSVAMLGGGPVDLEALAGALGDGAAGVLNLGWYRRRSGDLERRGGHWVTLVAVEPKTARVAVTDPAPRSGAGRQVHWIRLEPITAGRLVGKNENLPQPGEMHYRIVSGLELHPEAEEGVVDAAIVLRVRRP